MSEHSAGEKLFGKYDDLARLFIGFVLTTLIGSGLTFLFQHLTAKANAAAQFHQYEMSQATLNFSQISHLLDMRLYRTRRFVWLRESHTVPPTGIAPGDQTAADPNDDRKRYAESLFDWNENLNGNYALTERYFGNRMRMRLERVIAKYFRAINCDLAKPKPDFERIDQLLETLNPMIYKYNNDLLAALQSERIGTGRDMSKFSFPSKTLPQDCSAESSRPAAH